MSKRKKEKKGRQPPKEMQEVVYKPETGCFHFSGRRISIAMLESFFGLAALGKIMRIAIDDDNSIKIERVPEGVECYFGEILRLLKKYADDPKKGFEEIKRTTLFAEKIGAADKDEPFGKLENKLTG